MNPIIGGAQNTFDDYGSIIAENCLNCNEAEENKFVYARCIYADSLLKANVARFNVKLNKNYHGTQKYKIGKVYNDSYILLKKTRKNIFSNYDKLIKDGNNNHYTFLFYWYYTEKINEILIDMETTLFGDNPSQ